MNKARLFTGLLLAAVLVLFAPLGRAQNCQAAGSAINCNVIAVGPPTLMLTAAAAAVTGDPLRGNGPLCNAPNATAATRFWTGTANGRDASVGGQTIPDEPATVWIAWDSDTAPAIICAYLSLDSIASQHLSTTKEMDITVH